MTGASLREQFPLVRDCLYLNSNSTGAVPAGVEGVLRQYWRTLCRWRDDVWETEWLPLLRSYTDAVAAFIGAPPGTVVTEANVSTLLGRIASCFDYSTGRRTVVTTDLEFPSVPFIWRAFQRYGAELDVVGSGGPAFDEQALLDRIDERTLLVCVSHAGYATGAVLDLSPVVTRAHEVGALVVVDAFQTVGVVPVDVTALGVDFLLAGAHKWLCGVGTAFAYIRPDLLPSLRPAATGWLAGLDPMTFGPQLDWAPDARRFASGTPFPLTALISRVGLDLLAEVGIDAIRAHSLRCTERIMRRAEAAGIEVLGAAPPARRGGVVCLSFPGSDIVKSRLALRRMICSWRGSLRVAPHIYNTLDEVDAFMDAVDEERKALR
ncbi:MAG TPA: aminotransferase class V-fold PLP-dependent enzyme [Micromonosporaceae bacterium]